LEVQKDEISNQSELAEDQVEDPQNSGARGSRDAGPEVPDAQGLASVCAFAPTCFAAPFTRPSSSLAFASTTDRPLVSRLRSLFHVYGTDQSQLTELSIFAVDNLF
jgi:hypothetical protein